MADIKPPFTASSARAKVKAAQRLWNSRDAASVAKAYTEDSVWRNRDVFLRGHSEIEAFLRAKWARELDYRLRKELFAFGDERIAVQFWYEYRDGSETTTAAAAAAAAAGSRTVWRRAYGLEDWTFAPDGRMRKRQMSANDVEIKPEDRWFADPDVDVDDVKISEEHW